MGMFELYVSEFIFCTRPKRLKRSCHFFFFFLFNIITTANISIKLMKYIVFNIIFSRYTVSNLSYKLASQKNYNDWMEVTLRRDAKVSKVG
ncbi:hypothetical protein PUN28_015129 [Cardiocondyla obscurior]|uniref:Uncharacterized protein n=1 Tax=Cardiocondyla obscurior TaxID=286306 RepID=A0AAW2EX71_9HYME